MPVDSFHTSGNSPGPNFSRPAAVVSTARTCRVGVLGFGTVGSALAGGAVSGLELTHIFDRRAHQKRDRLSPDAPAHLVRTDRVDDLLTSDVDVIVEAIGGVEPAAGWIRAALLAGKSVVTANKHVIARQGPSLAPLVARQGRQLRFEAAVEGAMPIVRAVGSGLAGDCLTRIAAILNGTTNAVLSRMEATGCTMEAAVVEARARGYAEADPSADLDGLDAAAGGDATAVAVISDLLAIACDRAALVPAPRLSAPRIVQGLGSGARFVDFAERPDFARPYVADENLAEAV